MERDRVDRVDRVHVMQACPNDEFLYELASGGLDSEELTSADLHLDGCPGCRALLAELALAAGGGSGALRTGTMIGRYRIASVLGRGAMGTVYEAVDTDLERPIALKVLRNEIADYREDSLLREAVAMAKLSHANVVAVFEAGRADGAVYLTMELVRGRSLREWLREESPSWKEIRDVFIAAANGLSAAHDAGLVHRDIKPDNILIADDGTVKVGDFGVAGESGESSVDGHSSVDRTFLAAGTPAYMSPEQLAGKRADARSDQFSLCASMFECLSGSRPFGGNDVAEIARAIESESPSLPASAAPSWMMRAIMRGLSKDPDARFESLVDFRRAMETDTRRAPALRLALSVAAIAAVFAILWLATRPGTQELVKPCSLGEGLADSVWNSDRSRILSAGFNGDPTQTTELLDRFRRNWAADYRTVCIAGRVDRVESAVLTHARMHCLRRRLANADALVGVLERQEISAHRAVAAVDALPPSVECVALSPTSLADPPTQEQTAKLPAVAKQIRDAEAARLVGDVREAARKSKLAWDAAQAVGYAPITAEAALVHARAAAQDDRRRDAKVTARKALGLAMSVGADKLVFDALLTLTAVAGELGELDEALESAELARAALSRIGAPAQASSELDIAAAFVHLSRGELDRAQSLLDRADHRDLRGTRPRMLTALGELALARGELEKSLIHHREAFELNAKRLGDGHPQSAQNLHNIAGVLRRKGETDAALSTYLRALSLERAALGDDHTDVAATRNSIALVHLERDEPGRAIEQLKIAESIFSKAGAPELEAVQNNLALAQAQTPGQTATRKPAKKLPDPKGSYLPAKPWQPPR